MLPPAIISQVIGALLAGGTPAPVSARESAATGTNPAVLAAILATQRPAEPAPDVRLPRAAAVIAAVVVVGFFTVLAGIITLLVIRSDMAGSALAAFALLCVGFGVLASKFGTVVDYLFGSSWGSRQKDAWRPSGGQGEPIVIPAPPALPAPAEPPSESPAGEPNVLDADSFPRVHAVIAKWEGGYSDHPSDPGGATNYGITIGVLGEWRKRAVTEAEVKALTRAEAEDIFRARYWVPLRCADMPPPVALMVYNAGVNSGIGRGARFLQECLNKQGAAIDVDGSTGPLTLAALSRADVTRLVDDYAVTCEAFYRSLKTFSTFGRGWLNRLKDVTATAKKWMQEAPPAANTPVPASRLAYGGEMVALARQFIGRPYAHGLVPKDDASYAGAFDCAELASYIVYQVTGRLYGCIDNNELPASADAYTGAFRRDAHALGKIITVVEAARIPGAFVLRYPPSGGGMGHIALSVGDGTTIEAKSAAEGVVVDKVSGRRWDIGVLIPWVNYSGGGSVDVVGPAIVYAIGQPNMRADVIHAIQSALKDAGYDPGAIDSEYGPQTARAVEEFQRSRGLVQDGEVGPQTAAELGVRL